MVRGRRIVQPQLPAWVSAILAAQQTADVKATRQEQERMLEKVTQPRRGPRSAFKHAKRGRDNHKD